jgi:hypothetical protein
MTYFVHRKISTVLSVSCQSHSKLEAIPPPTGKIRLVRQRRQTARLVDRHCAGTVLVSKVSISLAERLILTTHPGPA